LYELALFAGAGGGLLATKWILGWQTVCYVENNPYRTKVLKARIRDGVLDDAPIWDDVRTFDGRPWRGCVDIVTAGFPCQPFSVAGRLEAADDSRNLWPDTIRVIREVRPGWCFLENVPGLLSGSHGYFGQILKELAESGYDARWRVLSAAEVGAPHYRHRLWMAAVRSGNVADTEEVGCRDGNPAYNRQATAQSNAFGHRGALLADTYCSRELQPQGGECSERGRTGDGRQVLAHPLQKRRDGRQGVPQTSGSPRLVLAEGDNPWAVEPQLGRVAHGVAHRVDRLGALGDGQVPAVVAVVWKLLMGESDSE